jgi:hypothetical protein
MGCAIAPLAGFSCGGIIAFIQVIAVLIHVGILFLCLRAGKVGWAVGGALVAGLAGLWLHGAIENRRAADAKYASGRAFEKLCYEEAFDSIATKGGPTDHLEVVEAQPSPEGAWSSNLFFHKSKDHRDWGFAALQPSEAAHNLRLTLSAERPDLGSSFPVYGELLQVTRIGTGEVIAARKNFVTGMDFSRGLSCLGRGWYDENDKFLRRIFGPRDLKYYGVEDTSVESYTKGQLSDVQTGTFKVAPMQVVPVLVKGEPRTALTRYSLVYDARVTLPDGRSILLIQIGGGNNFAPIQFLFDLRSDKDEEVERLYVQIPPGIDWSHGWGFDGDVKLSNGKLVFSLLGDKVPSSEKYYEGMNSGTYRQRVGIVAQIPVRWLSP